jgi:hypothetical protein
MTKFLGKPTTMLLMVGLAATTNTVDAATACATNDDCSAEEFCWLPDGECTPQEMIGLCWVIPSACPADYDPVCGCDYQTYSNDCMAHMAGVSMVHYGDCEPCETNPCGVEEFCQLPVGECSSGLGTCLVPPDSCETTCPQVCGCNDVSYANECQALVDGVSLSHGGPCNDRFDLIVANVGFTQHRELYWSHESGATSYNIYRAVATHATSMDAAVCFLPDVPGPYRPIPGTPNPEEVWYLLVNGNFADGEGSLAESTDCTARLPVQSCH